MLSNRRIRQIADRGDRKILESYIKENAKKANRRMRDIEKKRANRRGVVYDIAKNKLESMNRKTFGSRLSTLSLDELEEQALSLNNYLRAKTSTYRGLVTRENRIIRALANRGYKVENRDLFFQILDSDMISEYADLDSGEVMKSASQWANSDNYEVLNAIQKAEEEYRNNEEIYIDDAFKLIQENLNKLQE